MSPSDHRVAHGNYVAEWYVNVGLGSLSAIGKAAHIPGNCRLPQGQNRERNMLRISCFSNTSGRCCCSYLCTVCWRRAILCKATMLLWCGWLHERTGHEASPFWNQRFAFIENQCRVCFPVTTTFKFIYAIENLTDWCLDASLVWCMSWWAQRSTLHSCQSNSQFLRIFGGEIINWMLLPVLYVENDFKGLLSSIPHGY